MSRVSSPVWRLVGSFASWVVFTFAFLGLYQSAGAVIGLGGFCASGGPYVIEVECPESVALFAPGGIFGMFLGVGIAVFVAQGFGVLLTAWAWPILFVGLGLQFLFGAFTGVGVVSNAILAVMFIVMGLVPPFLSIRTTGIAPDFLGTIDIEGRRFATGDRPNNPLRYSPVARGEEVAPTARDWALSLGVWAAAVALGTFLSFAAFRALSGG